MNAAVQNLVISLGVMQGIFHRQNILRNIIHSLAFLVARKIPFDNPEVLMYVRIAYVAAQAIILGVYYYISLTVCRKKNHVFHRTIQLIH